MKLTLVISSLGPGGAERVLSELANHWDSKNHGVTLITFGNDPPFYLLSSSIKLVQLNQLLSDSVNFLKRYTSIIKRVRCLRKAILKSKPDVVVSFVDIMNLTTLVACIGTKIPVIVSERIDPNFHAIPRLYKFLREIICPCAKKVVVQTKIAAAYFKNLKNVVIIPNVVKKKECIVRNFSSPVKNIISIGRLCRQKDFETLINAFAKIYLLYPEITLIIYGEGEERSNLEHLIQSLNLEACVRLPGAITEIDRVLNDADLFVFPSLYEGFPNALCEAMAAGLPVIASNCSGNVDIVQNGVNGRLFPVGDVKILSKLMNELIFNCEQRRHLSENAMKLSNIYSEEKIYALWDEIVKANFNKP